MRMKQRARVREWGIQLHCSLEATLRIPQSFFFSLPTLLLTFYYLNVANWCELGAGERMMVPAQHTLFFLYSKTPLLHACPAFT